MCRRSFHASACDVRRGELFDVPPAVRCRLGHDDHGLDQRLREVAVAARNSADAAPGYVTDDCKLLLSWEVRRRAMRLSPVTPDRGSGLACGTRKLALTGVGLLALAVPAAQADNITADSDAAVRMGAHNVIADPDSAARIGAHNVIADPDAAARTASVPNAGTL
jgi:hypothetical protein